MKIEHIEDAIGDPSQGRFKGAEWFIKPLDIIIGGAGGISSWTAMFLSRIGHKLSIFDHDHYEVHNMSGQFIDNNSVGQNKATAIINLCSRFSGDGIPDHQSFGFYDEDSPTSNVVISGFDNMKARRTMYNNWVEFLKNNPSERSSSIFIDGRLLAEQYQVFAVQGDKFNQVKGYYDYLFSDDEVEEAECTFKQTSHVAAMVGGMITSTLNNWITNKVHDAPVRRVPFFQEHFAPAMYQEVKMEPDESN